MKEKITEILSKIKVKLAPIDSKMQSLIPDAKIRKILYIGLGAIASIFVLLILLAIILTPLRVTSDQTGSIFRRPEIKQGEEKKEVLLTPNQTKIKNLSEKIKSLQFPESLVNPPEILLEITIENKR